MHSDEVITMSTKIVTMAGPAALGPNSATSRGTPIKPVLGKAATNAPNDASFQPIRAFLVTAMVKATITNAQNRYMPKTLASSNCAIGVDAPKRKSMQGKAKNSTKLFKPGMAACGNMPLRAAI